MLARRLTSALQFCLNFHNPSFIFSIECGYVCPQTGQVCSSSLIIACILLCGVFGSVPLGRASLACLGCVFVWLALALWSRVVFLLRLQGSSLLLLLFPGFGVVVASSFVCLGGLGACGVTCSFLASPLPSPLGCPLVLSGPVSLAGPSLRISGCICDGPVVIPLAWRVVAIGSCLPSASWQQRLRPCVGLCPLHHAVRVVHVPLAAALRYLPSGDPESPLNTAKAARAYLGLCCLLLPASAAFPGVRSFLFAGLRLPPSPRAPAVFGLACLPRCPLSCLVFLPPLFCGCGLGCWRGLFFFVCLGEFVWLPCVLVVSFCLVFVLAPRVCWLCLTLVWTGTFVYFAFTCTTKALIDHYTCVSVHWLDSLTCIVEFHRSTTSFLVWFCLTIR